MNSTIQELFYIQMKSTWTSDNINLFLIGPLGILGFILNIISFRTFNKIKFKKKTLKNYLEVYTLFCSIMCFILMFIMIFRTPRYFNLEQNLVANIYNCKIVYYMLITIIMFINIIDCIILFERLSNFRNKGKLNSFFDYNAYKVCSLLFGFTALLNSPNIFFFDIKFDSDFEAIKYDYNRLIKFVYCDRNNFFDTLVGQMIIVIIVLIKDVCTLIAEIVLNITCFLSFKYYFKNKLQQFYVNLDLTRHANNYSRDITSESLKRSIYKIESYSTKLTQMTIYLSIFSILSHLFLALIYVMNLAEENVTRLYGFLSMLFLMIKIISNFFLFYFFNKNFRLYVKQFYKILFCY
jgi:hypothetical protein